MGTKLKIGVLSLQGAVNEHITILNKLHCQPMVVKNTEHLQDIDGLIIPGGESTTIGKLMREREMIKTIKTRVRAGMGIFGTCAGLVLLAKNVVGSTQPLLSLIDIKVKRNAFGSQVNSFETNLNIPEISSTSFKAVFIRAPVILNSGDNVETLAAYKDQKVLARQNKILVSSFHPELTDDLRLHMYFLKLLK